MNFMIHVQQVKEEENDDGQDAPAWYTNDEIRPLPSFTATFASNTPP